MLKFKEYIQNEELTVGTHNDGAGPFNTSTGAYLSSDQSGSETFPPRSTHLTSTDMVIQNLPSQKLEGKIYKVHRGPNGSCTLHIWTPQGGSMSHRIDYESLRRIPGFTKLEDVVKRKISLVTQGNDKHGNLHVRYGTIS